MRFHGTWPKGIGENPEGILITDRYKLDKCRKDAYLMYIGKETHKHFNKENDQWEYTFKRKD